MLTMFRAREIPWPRLLAEGVAIVVSILLALWIQAWWQARADREDEAASLVRLVRDLEDDILDLKGNLDRARTGLHAARWLAENRGTRPADISALKQALFDIGHCSILLLNSSEYTSLRNSGDFRLIRDKELLQTITALYEERTFLYQLHEKDCADSQDVVQLTMPYVRHTIPPLFRPNGGSQGWQLWDQPMVEEVADSAGLLSDAILINSVVALAADRQFLIEREETALQDTKRLQTAIQGELD
jgi:hypothetical protein